MSQYSPRPAPHPRPVHPPFTRIACLVDTDAGTDAAVTQAITLAGDDAAVRFVALSHARGPLEQAVERARDAGCTAEPELLQRATFNDALGRVNVLHDLVVVGAHEHARATGIVLGEAATQLFAHFVLGTHGSKQFQRSVAANCLQLVALVCAAEWARR